MKPISTNSSDAETRILLVDDNLTNRMVAKAMLSKRSIKPDEAADGIEAVEKTLLSKYDLIFMDCMMPQLDGYEAAARIRESSDNPNQNTPIIALTANVMEGDRDKCLESGMNDYIEKPLRPQRLNEIIDQWALRETVSLSPEFSAAKHANHNGALDFNQLYETFNHDYATVKQLYSVFESSLRDDIPQILDTIEKKDFSTATRQAHTLKGSAANYGAPQLRELAADAEDCFKKGEFETAVQHLLHAIEESKRVIKAINAHPWPSS